MTDESKTPELAPTTKQLENRINDLESKLKDFLAPKPEPKKAEAAPAPAPAPKKKEKRKKLFDFRLWDDETEHAKED